MSVPLKTRLALFFPVFTMAYAPLLATGVLIALLLTSFYWITLIYITFRVIDYRSPHRGGWSRRCRRSFLNVLKNYFPCDFVVVDKSRFDKNKNYILCAHPHGTIPYAVVVNFLTDTIKETLELDSSLVILPAFFWSPGSREIFLSLGASAASNDNMNYVLQNQRGCAIAAVPGGLKEIELFAPHSMEIRTSAVRGYAKLALQHGAQLVPVINFGETELYGLVPLHELSPLARVLKFTTELLFSAKIPNFRGQGHLGVMPLRRPLTTLVGNPIWSPRLANPSFDDVQGLYLKYCQALKDLYHENRDRYGYDDVEMNICID